jgi:hypothetical protein
MILMLPWESLSAITTGRGGGQLRRDDIPGLSRNPTREMGRAVMCGPSQGLEFIDRHSVATSLRPTHGRRQ